VEYLEQQAQLQHQQYKYHIMFLREFINFDTEHADPQENDRYNSDDDTSVLRRTDLRKTRLTLGMLNDLRKAGDSRERERKEELGLVRKMYMPPPAEGMMPPMQ
jgi:hypothetical protein